MNKQKRFIIILIVILAFILRFYRLGLIPNSPDWDEASLGYNAYSILKTGKDEYGITLPAQFKSFTDYKPPLYVYASLPFIWIFGLNEFGTRFASALLGTLAVVLTYYLVKNLIPNKSRKYHLLAMFLMAISVWHLQFSRVAFEANAGLFWFIAAALFFLKTRHQSGFLILSGLCFALSLYSYHSTRLVVPIFIFSLTVIYFKHLWQIKKLVIISLMLNVILLLPLLISLTKGVTARFASVSSVNQESLTSSITDLEFDRNRKDYLGQLLHNRRVVYALSFVKGYLDHWDPLFLFIKGDAPDRHHAPDTGMLYLVELPFVILGIYYLIFSHKGKGIKFIWLWFLVAPCASALTTGTPHAVRALLYLPTYQIFIALGIYKLLDLFKRIKPVFLSLKLLYLILVICYLLNVYRYLNLYYIQAPFEQAPSWQYGYKEMVQKVSRLKNNYSKIIITYKYDQPYIYFLFYEKTDPQDYQKNWLYTQGNIQRFNRAYGNYEFRNINWLKDKELPGTLFVGTPEEIPQNDSHVIDKVFFPDGSTAFVIAKT